MSDSPYPHTPEAIAINAMLGGPSMAPVPNHISDQFSKTYAMHGSRDLDTISKNPAVAGTTPWPTAGKTKKGPAYDRDLVAQAIMNPPDPVRFDPRNLHSTQSGITRQGVDYYLNDPTYADTGTTFADAERPGNQHPIVYHSRTTQRNLILSGHHRAGAALLAGKPLEAIRVEGP